MATTDDILTAPLWDVVCPIESAYDYCARRGDINNGVVNVNTVIRLYPFSRMPITMMLARHPASKIQSGAFPAAFTMNSRPTILLISCPRVDYPLDTLPAHPKQIIPFEIDEGALNPGHASIVHRGRKRKRRTHNNNNNFKSAQHSALRYHADVFAGAGRLGPQRASHGIAAVKQTGSTGTMGNASDEATILTLQQTRLCAETYAGGRPTHFAGIEPIATKTQNKSSTVIDGVPRRCALSLARIYCEHHNNVRYTPHTFAGLTITLWSDTPNHTAAEKARVARGVTADWLRPPAGKRWSPLALGSVRAGDRPSKVAMLYDADYDPIEKVFPRFTKIVFYDTNRTNILGGIEVHHHSRALARLRRLFEPMLDEFVIVYPTAFRTDPYRFRIIDFAYWCLRLDVPPPATFEMEDHKIDVPELRKRIAADIAYEATTPPRAKGAYALPPWCRGNGIEIT